MKKLIKIDSVKDEDSIEFRWIVDFLRPHYKSKIDDYITFLLGHEGTNRYLIF